MPEGIIVDLRDHFMREQLVNQMARTDEKRRVVEARLKELERAIDYPADVEAG